MLSKELEARLLPSKGEYRIDPFTGEWFKMSDMKNDFMDMMRSIMGSDFKP